MPHTLHGLTTSPLFSPLTYTAFSDNILLPVINWEAVKSFPWPSHLCTFSFHKPNGWLCNLNSSTDLKISFHLGSSCFSLWLCRLKNSAFDIVCKEFISVIHRNMPHILIPPETSMAGYIFNNVLQTAKYLTCQPDAYWIKWKIIFDPVTFKSWRHRLRFLQVLHFHSLFPTTK